MDLRKNIVMRVTVTDARRFSGQERQDKVEEDGLLQGFDNIRLAEVSKQVFQVQRSTNQIIIISDFLKAMNYLVGPLCTPFCYVFVPTPAFAPYTAPIGLSLLANSPLENAEINTTGEEESQKLTVSRDDLLQEGYEQTKRAWTEEQDVLLLRLCKDENARFDEICKVIPGRNAKMCYSRFRRLSNQSKDCWSKSEDNKLCSLVTEYGSDNWQLIAQHFAKRNHKQLKDHYENYLRPNLSKEEWTLEEDLLLIDLFNTYGKDWKLIQTKMFKRSRNQIKNRFFGRILRLEAKKKDSQLKPETCVKEQAFAYQV